MRADNGDKREKRLAKKERADKLTNWYMINLSWGVLGIFFLKLIEKGYGSADGIAAMPYVMWTAVGILLAAAIALFSLNKVGKIKNSKRAVDYSVFMLLCAVVGAFIAAFANVRNVVIAVIPALGNLRSEWWFSWIWMILIVAYLIVTLVWYAVKLYMIDHGKAE